jgi:hypothetical protein
MNLVSRLTPRPLKEFFSSLLHGGLRAVAAEEVALIQGDVLDAQEKVLDKAVELARKTRPLRESGDDLERELAADFAATLRETSQLGRAMLGQATPEERREILSGPLPGLPGGTTPSLPAASQPSPTPEPKAALQPPSDGSGTPAEPAKRKRGRPSNAERERRQAEALNGAAQGNGVARNGRL